MVPKTTTFKQVKSQAAATRAKLKGEKSGSGGAAAAAAADDAEAAPPNGHSTSSNKKQKSTINGTNGFSSRSRMSMDGGDPSSQLEMEMREAARHGRDGDVDMTG